MDERIWDPLRKKYVAATPEEKVRQWFIGVLHDSMKIPFHMMASEVGLKYGAEYHKKEFRADVVVYDRSLRPMLLVECKKTDVELTRDVLVQALTYNMILGAPYIVITNGKSTFVFCRRIEDMKYGQIACLPAYEDMLGYANGLAGLNESGKD